MGRPSKTVVYNANVTALGDVAEPTRALGTKVLDAAGTVHGTIIDLEWEGDGKDGAVSRADRELAQDKRVVEGYNTLADACQNGATVMGPMIADLKKFGQNLESESFAVSEAWEVADTFNYEAGKAALIAMGASEESATDQMNQLRTARSNEAQTEATNLQQRADALGQADQNTADAINNAKSDIAAAAPVTAGLSGDEGQHDLANAIANSQYTGMPIDPKMLERMIAAGTLSQADLDKLARGEKIEIPAGQMAYLYQLSQSLNGMTPEQIRALQQTLPAEAQAALAQGLKIVSDPNVQVAGADQIKQFAQGATDETRGRFVPLTGSMVNLPSEIKKELSRTDRVSIETTRGGPVITHLNGVGALQDINDIFTPGATIAGSEATKSMLEAASQYADADGRHYEGLGQGLVSDARGSLTSALADVYQNASKDHLTMHDMITGSGGDNFLRAVTHEHWGEDANRVGDAFRWTHDTNSPFAGETANKVAHWLSDNKSDLNDMPGTGNPITGHLSFAVTNPGLAEAMADGVSPYLAQLAQAPADSGLTYPGVEAFTNGGQLQNLFSVFDKSEGSAKLINDAAYQQYQRLIENAAHPGLHGMQAEIAGRLTNAMTDGALDSIKPGSQSDLGVFKMIFGKIPGAEYAFDAMDIYKKIQEGHPPSEFAQQLATAGTSSTAMRATIINGMIEANPEIANNDLIKPYIKDGRIDLTGLSLSEQIRAENSLKDYFTLNAKGVDTEIGQDIGHGTNDNWGVSR